MQADLPLLFADGANAFRTGYLWNWSNYRVARVGPMNFQPAE